MYFFISATYRDSPVPATEHFPQNDVLEKGIRLLGIDVTKIPKTNYDIDAIEAKQIGADFVHFSISWDEIEPKPNEYDDSVLSLVNGFYPSQDIQILFVITPIDTNHSRVVSDLKDKSFDDPEVISRFNKMMDYVYEKTPDLQYTAIAIGNEIDSYLDSPEEWKSYEEFYRQTKEHIKSKDKWLDVPVGTKSQFSGIAWKHPEEIQSINQYSDVFMVTYYPLNDDFTFKDPQSARSDIELVIQRAEDKPIYFLEMGYPSGSIVNSSTEKQKEFVIEVFKTWDEHAEHIKVINFTWMRDISQLESLVFAAYYMVPDPKFTNFLSSLGLKYNDGQPKSAWIALKEEASIRGWK